MTPKFRHTNFSLKMFRKRNGKRNEKVTVPSAKKELKKGTVPVF